MLYPVIRKGRCGFIDDEGQVVVDYQFDYAEPFSEDLAVVKDRGVYAWIDTSGRIVGKDEAFEFDELHAFKDGCAWVSLNKHPPGRTGNFGFITSGGQLFSDGLANSREFSDGMAAISRDGITWGYIDPSGKEVIPAGEGSHNPFSEGVAANSSNTKIGFHYIDKAGQPVIILPEKTFYASEFSEGVAQILISNRGIVYVDHEGNSTIQLPPEIEVAKEFQNGFAAVRRENKWGFIDKRGEIIIQPIFNEASSFSNELAVIKSDSGYGYINPDGSIAVVPEFTMAFPFAGALARTHRSSKMLYIDKSGRIIWEEE